MPVIVAANPKGGSGKSTTCLVIGTTLASQGASVRIIDADPQGTLAMWSEGSSKYRDLVVKPTANEDRDPPRPFPPPRRAPAPQPRSRHRRRGRSSRLQLLAPRTFLEPR